jgi:hypothetical protein
MLTKVKVDGPFGRRLTLRLAEPLGERGTALSTSNGPDYDPDGDKRRYNRARQILQMISKAQIVTRGKRRPYRGRGGKPAKQALCAIYNPVAHSLHRRRFQAQRVPQRSYEPSVEEELALMEEEE